jgi:ADP-heptose:LPS heptosyltransferase
MINKEAFRSAKNRHIAEWTEVFTSLLWKYAQRKCPVSPTIPSEWRKALIIGDNHIGDLLYRSGSLEHLKRGLPECDFYYLASPGSAEVLAHSPWLKDVLPFCQSDARLDLLKTPAFEVLKGMSFDAAICSNPVHYPQDLKLALELGIPSRAGYIYKGFSGWVTHPIRIKYPQPFPTYFRDFVAQLTRQKPTWSNRPVVQTTEADMVEADDLWQRLRLDSGKPVIACFMTSRQPSGVWPTDSFARALQLLASRKNVSIVLCGAKNDEEVLTRINRDYNLNASINAGELGLRALVCFLKRTAVIVCPDSGSRHLGNAAGVPVVFIRNLAVKKIETGAYCDTEYDMAPDVECVPSEDQDRLLRQTTPEMVAAKVGELLRK